LRHGWAWDGVGRRENTHELASKLADKRVVSAFDVIKWFFELF
jgi:hypothetical protein